VTSDRRRAFPAADRRQRPRYTLDDLLAKCHPKAPPGKEDREWLEALIAGDEII
jgi:antitoxin ChpS